MNSILKYLKNPGVIFNIVLLIYIELFDTLIRPLFIQLALDENTRMKYLVFGIISMFVLVIETIGIRWQIFTIRNDKIHNIESKMIFSRYVRLLWIGHFIVSLFLFFVAFSNIGEYIGYTDSMTLLGLVIGVIREVFIRKWIIRFYMPYDKKLPGWKKIITQILLTTSGLIIYTMVWEIVFLMAILKNFGLNTSSPSGIMRFLLIIILILLFIILPIRIGFILTEFITVKTVRDKLIYWLMLAALLYFSIEPLLKIKGN